MSDLLALPPPPPRASKLEFKNELNWNHVIWAATMIGGLIVGFWQFTSMININRETIARLEMSISKIQTQIDALGAGLAALDDNYRQVRSDLTALAQSHDRTQSELLNVVRRQESQADQLVTVRENLSALTALVRRQSNFRDIPNVPGTPVVPPQRD